jgi:hypothetical protein
MKGSLIKLVMASALVFSPLLAMNEAMARPYAERTLNWDCPTTRTDGSAFACATDAAGYDLEVKTSPTATATIVEISNSSTSRIITADAAGTLYRIRVCDLAGECSAWSDQVKKPSAPGKVNINLK